MKRDREVGGPEDLGWELSKKSNAERQNLSTEALIARPLDLKLKEFVK